MKYKDFYPFGTGSVILRFNCNKCNTAIKTDEISVPLPDFTAENTADSQTENDSSVECEKCKKLFTIIVGVNFNDGWVTVNELKETDDLFIDELFELDPYYVEQIDAILFNTEYFNTFSKGIDSIKDLNTLVIENPESDKMFRRQLFSNVITCMETYLSDGLINLVISNKDYLKAFVKSYKAFKNQKFNLNEVFSTHERICEIVKMELLDLIYHNLRPISEIYKATFSIDFPAIGKALKYVRIRHDLVHRNGKTKDGEEILITKESVEDVITQIVNFVGEIEEKLNEL